MAFENVELGSIIDRSCESVRSFAEQHDVNLVLPQTDVRVIADGDRIVQVLVNLLSNAIKFSDKDASVVVAVEEQADYVQVKVSDRGRGIPEKYQSLIFERFQQVEVSDAKRRGGTGLGLAICKGIIEQHRGSIGVESEEGKGSTFWFRMPKATSRIAANV